MSIRFVQSQNFSLAGAGIIVGATSIVLKAFAGIDGALLTMTDFGTLGFATLEPGNSTQEEQISFTGVTQNANGTATLTGVSSVLFVSPYTATGGVLKTHPGSTSLIISNTAGFYNQFVLNGSNTAVSFRLQKRVVATANSATPTINTDNTDVANITGLSQNITSMTTNLTGTPNPYDTLFICFTDNGTGRSITWGASFESSTVALPSSTIANTLLIVGLLWNSVTSKWRCVGVA